LHPARILCKNGHCHFIQPEPDFGYDQRLSRSPPSPTIDAVPARDFGFARRAARSSRKNTKAGPGLRDRSTGAGKHRLECARRADHARKSPSTQRCR